MTTGERTIRIYSWIPEIKGLTRCFDIGRTKECPRVGLDDLKQERVTAIGPAGTGTSTGEPVI